MENFREAIAEFPYELFNVVLSNKSFVDIKRLDIDTYEDAYNFVKNYGFDMDDANQREQVFNILSEAKQFIQTYLLEDPENLSAPLAMPPNILFEDDIRNFLVMASNKERNLSQRWACAVLRVVHTITHVENDLAKYFFQGIKKQIFSRFMEHLKVDNDNNYLLGRGKQQIVLNLFEMKSEKSRESLIMKLLHKKENVSADVFDRVGVRIVTKDKLDAILVLKYFSENHVISFANIKPSRTRNNLVDVEKLLVGLELLKNQDITGWNDEDVKAFLKPHLVFEPEDNSSIAASIKENNPYSSTEYTSIQITARQLITIPDPFNFKVSYRFFFPFELQILDQESFEDSRTGRASHDEYKKNQTLAVRRRVIGHVIDYLDRNQNCS